MPQRKNATRFDSEDVQGEGSFVVCTRMTVLQQHEARNWKKDAFDLGIKVLQEHILEWNWVDDDGEPLPQVPDEPDVVYKLLNHEVEFLTGCIQGSDKEAKN